MRCFIAINLPDETKREIEKIQKSLPEFKGKKTEFENIHLTLKFLGEVDEKNIHEVLKRLGKIRLQEFEAEIDSIGCFDNRKSKKYDKQIIVWLHMANCNALQKEIDLALREIFEREKRFMSHITIARVKYKGDNKEFIEELKKIKFKKITLKIRDFYLMKSELDGKGLKYGIVEKFGLKKKIHHKNTF